jgi:hypothetical protein
LLAGEAEVLGGLPDAPMVVRHRHVGDAQMGKGVVDGIGEGRDAADIRRFPDPLGAVGQVKLGAS